jgi:hypothetical protein
MFDQVKFCITKSRSGHYSVTARASGHSASVGKLSCLLNAQNAKPEAQELLLAKIAHTAKVLSA